jgi:dolichol-phosphate mannosyltransferase
MRKIFVSVVLPTFNERENIVPLILEIDKQIKAEKEIIVVDDNSPDGTVGEVKNLIRKKKIQNLKIIVRKKNHGLTPSLWEGVVKSKGEIIIWMDCDFSHPPILIPKIIEQINKGNDLAVASRFIKGGGFKKNIQGKSDSILQVVLSRVMNYSIQILLGSGFKDYTSGFIAIRRNVFKDIKLYGDYGEYFIDLITRSLLLKYKVVEIPFINLPRKYGKSKTGSSLYTLLKRGTRYINVSIRLFVLKLSYKLRLTNDIRSQTKKFK